MCPPEQRQERLDNSYRLSDPRTVTLLDHTYSQKAEGLLVNRWQHQWGSVLVAAVLGGLVGVTAAVAAGEQFLPILGACEEVQRALQIPLANGFIDYLTLLNERHGSINGVKLVWEECATVYDVARGVECYERLKAKGATGAAVVVQVSDSEGLANHAGPESCAGLGNGP